MLGALQRGGFLKKQTFFYRFADAGLFLHSALPRPNILVSYLGVAHLALWKPDRLPRSFYRCMRPLTRKFINIGRIGKSNSIAFFTRVDSPSIHDNQDKRARSPRRSRTHVVFLFHIVVQKIDVQ